MVASTPVDEANALDLASFIEQYLSNIGLTFPSDSAPPISTITVTRASSMDTHDLSSCLALIAKTSQVDYAASSQGWHPKRKLKEMKLPDLRYLLVRASSDSNLIGFASFMLTYEDGKEVIYLYEIHMDEGIRGKGLGKFLMNIVEEVGRRASMEKVMLTVFACNEPARHFYSGLGYAVDDFSPGARTLRNGRVKEPDYLILSKPLKSK